MDLLSRIGCLTTAVFTSAIWYGACFLVSFGLFNIFHEETIVWGMPQVEARFTLAMVLFIGGFLISIIRRSTSLGSLESADKSSRRIVSAVGDGHYAHSDTSAFTIFYIASFLPDLAIGAFRVAIGFEEVETAFTDQDTDVY